METFRKKISIIVLVFNIICMSAICFTNCDPYDEVVSQEIIVESGLEAALDGVRAEYAINEVSIPPTTFKWKDLPDGKVGLATIGTHRNIVYVDDSFKGRNRLLIELILFHEVGHVMGLNHGPGIMSANLTDTAIFYGAGRADFLKHYFNQIKEQL